MDSSKVDINETDLTFSVGDLAVGRSAVQVKTKRGPIADPSVLVGSWTQFLKLFGGLVNGNDGPLQCKRALDRGSALRVARVVHWDDSNSDELPYSAELATAASTKKFVLASALLTGQSIIYTQDVVVITQPFVTSSLNTLNLLAAAIKKKLAEVAEIYVLNQTTFFIANKDAIAIGAVTTSGPSAPAVTTTSSATIHSAAGDELFELVLKYAGEDYNNLSVFIMPASNGNVDSFDLATKFSSPGETPITKSYKNLKIVGQPTVLQSDYLKKIQSDSEAMITVSYKDLSGLTGTLVPQPQVLRYANGSDGDEVTASDYIGTSDLKNGFHAFDGIDDVMQIAILDDVSSLVGVHESGSDYAATRKDLQYFMHLTSNTESALVTERQGINVDTSYVGFFAGGVNQVNPQTSEQTIISELGDVLGIAAYSEKRFGPQFSFSGLNRGLVANCLGSGNLFGAAGNSVNLDYLANNQINVVIDRSRKTVLWGSFTGQLDSSVLSFMNVRRSHIYLRKALGPILEKFIEEPNDFITWKTIYLTVKPFLDGLITNRSFFEYSWQGDQFASQLSDLVINNPDDIQLGKYKAKLFTKDIVSLQTFELGIILTPDGVSFEDAILVTQN